MVGGAVAAVVHRRLCCFKSCLMRFCAQLDVPTCLIQAQDLLGAPVLARQGRDQQHPSCQIQGVCLHLLLVPLRGPLLAPLCRRALLFAQSQPNTAHGELLALIADPDPSAHHPSCRGVAPFEPADHIQWLARSCLQWKLMRRKAHHQIGPFPEHKDNALAQAIGAISDDQISCLQVKDFQMFSLLPIRHLELGQPTRQPVRGSRGNPEGVASGPTS